MIARTKASRTNGFAATAAGSMAMPEVTKNTGISSPNASPSSLCSNELWPPG
jgi:hypothetical protein